MIREDIDNMLMEQNQGKRINNIAVLLTAVCFTLLFCGSSFLVSSFRKDSSVFYTIGRGIVQHKVAYKDLFDHKGLYLYLLNALGVLIADRHTFGLWLVETVFAVADCFLIFRIARKMSASESVALMTVVLTLIFASFFWEGGNLTETYGMLPELISLSMLLNVYQDGKEGPFHARKMFFIGVCAGVELFLRANMLMAWIPVAVIVIGTEVRNKRFRNVGRITLYGVLGVLSASAIPMYYCLKNGCLPEMFFASFLFNMRYVGDRPGQSALFSSIYKFCFFLMAAGLGTSSTVIVWRRGQSRLGRWLFLSSYLFAVTSVLLSGRLFVHYNLYLVPFALPVLVCLASFVSSRMSKKSVLIMLSLLMIVGVVTSSSFARVTVKKIIHYSGTDYSAQERIASKLETDYPEVRNVLVANGSAWYYARLNVVPEERFFYLPSVDYGVFPDAVDSQAAAIMDGVADAVILRWTYAKGKIWLPNGTRNEEVTAGLEMNYSEVFSAGDTSLYLRKDIS